MLCPDKSILWRWRFDSHFEIKRIFVYCKFYRIVTNRPLGERNEHFLAAKRPTASDEVPRHMKSDDGLFWKSTNFIAAYITENVSSRVGYQPLCKTHAKKPESGLFFDWIGNNSDDLRCSDWPKRSHPLVVVDFSLHFCLRNEQRIHTRALWFPANSVFLNSKNV